MPNRNQNDSRSTQHKGQQQSHTPQKHAAPRNTQHEPTADDRAMDSSEAIQHGTNDAPEELIDALRETLSQYDYENVGYTQQSNNNSFLRLKMFESEVMIAGKTYPCKVLIQFQMAREQVEQAA